MKGEQNADSKRILLDNIPLKLSCTFSNLNFGKRILLDNIPLKPQTDNSNFNYVRESY